MTAPPARANIADNPSRATAKAAFGALWDYVTERLGGGAGSASAAEKVAARVALEATRSIQPLSASVAANALTLTLNPTTLELRSATLSSGTVNTRAITTALSLVISSGSTLGTVSGTPSRLAVLALDNAGTVELAVVNMAGAVALDEAALISTTAEGGAGAADSASTIYSATARTNVPFRVVGYVESTQAAAGTWATAPSKIQGAGGMLKSLNSTAITVGTPVTLSGQTEVDFVGIPADAKVVTVLMAGVSTNGSSPILVQLNGETVGYLGSSVTAAADGSGGNANSSYTTGFGIRQIGATQVSHGTMAIELLGANTWVATSIVARSDSAVPIISGGSKTLSAQLSTLRFATVNGTDALDAGIVNIKVDRSA